MSQFQNQSGTQNRNKSVLDKQFHGDSTGSQKQVGKSEPAEYLSSNPEQPIDIKAYMNSKKQLLYVTLPIELGEKLFAKSLHVKHIHDNRSNEVHLTTDGMFGEYLDKRLVIPKMVVIHKTRRELNTVLEQYNLFI